MNTEEILKFAKENFPIGTRFISAYSDEEVIMNDDLVKPDMGWLTPAYLIVNCKDKNGKEISGRGLYLFHQGKWATKVFKNYELW